MQLEFKNSKVLDFIEKHKNISPENLFAQFIDIYDYIYSSIANNNTTQVLPYILELTNKNKV